MPTIFTISIFSAVLSKESVFFVDSNGETGEVKAQPTEKRGLSNPLGEMDAGKLRQADTTTNSKIPKMPEGYQSIFYGKPKNGCDKAKARFY